MSSLETRVSLRNWSFVRVLLSGIAWIVLVLVIALPRVLSLPTGVSFGPPAMFLVLLLTFVPPLLLGGLWLWQRSRPGQPPGSPR